MFWDSSALVATLLDEPRSQQFIDAFDDDPVPVIWWGTPLECHAAVVRAVRVRAPIRQPGSASVAVARRTARGGSPAFSAGGAAADGAIAAGGAAADGSVGGAGRARSAPGFDAGESDAVAAASDPAPDNGKYTVTVDPRPSLDKPSVPPT